MQSLNVRIENDLCYKNPAKHCTYRSTAQKHIKHVLSDEQMETVKAYTADRMPGGRAPAGNRPAPW